MNLRNYEAALQYGAVIVGTDVALATVRGAHLSQKVQYDQIALNVSGTTTIVNVFDQATAPVSGTVTGFYVVAGVNGLVGSGGTAALWATTAGTIVANLAYGTTGAVVGTYFTPAAIVAGDTVQVQGSSGTFVAYVTFKTIN